MTRRKLILILATTTALSALALGAARARDLPKVATGFVASVLCSETFVSGQDPETIFTDTTAAMPGARLISWAMDYRLDRTAKDVTVRLFGLGESHAVYRGALGCTLDHGEPVPLAVVPADSKVQPALLPDIAGPAVVPPATPQLEEALDRAFAEPKAPPFRRTRAIVVVKEGRVIAERYADGYGIDTPILGFSATKSVISALIGILVRQGRAVARQARAGRGVAEGRRSAPRHHGRSVAAPHRRAGARQLAPGFTRRRARAGQPHEIHGIGHGRLCGAHAARDHAGQRVELQRRQQHHSLASDPQRDRRTSGRRAALRPRRAVRAARHAPRDAGIRRRGNAGGIEPDAGVGTRLGAVRPALSQ